MTAAVTDEGRILERLDYIAADVKEIKSTLKAMNGRVRENEKNVAILSETCLRMNVIKMSAIVGAVVIVVLVAAWFVTGGGVP